MQTWKFLYFLFNKYIRFKNQTYWSFYLYGRFETIHFEIRRFETWRFVNLTFCKPDVLKPDVLKPDILKPDVLKPDVLWVYLPGTNERTCYRYGRKHCCDCKYLSVITVYWLWIVIRLLWSVVIFQTKSNILQCHRTNTSSSTGLYRILNNLEILYFIHSEQGQVVFKSRYHFYSCMSISSSFVNVQ